MTSCVKSLIYVPFTSLALIAWMAGAASARGGGGSHGGSGFQSRGASVGSPRDAPAKQVVGPLAYNRSVITQPDDI